MIMNVGGQLENIGITMIREHLRDIPQYELPPGYSMRRYRPGDKRTWLEIHDRAEFLIKVTGKTFDENFGYDLAAMPKRCYFLVSPDGQDIGTITAWYIKNYHGRAWGRIHWVAIVPEYQGKGLSKPIMTIAMNRLRSLGHRRAMLTTATPRIAALKTYLEFGFVPDMRRDRAQEAWSMVARVIEHPALRALRGVG